MHRGPSTHSMGLGLKEMLIGENPLDTERLWQKMYVGSCMNGRRGAVINAIGAIDMALWDIKGKAAGKPCWELLLRNSFSSSSVPAGPAVPSITPYASLQPDGDDVELLLRDDVATFRAAARRKGLTPPWCTEKNCINGSMAQRKRVLALGAKLGWSPIDSTNMEDEGRWTPIFFNTDAVPRDDE